MATYANVSNAAAFGVEIIDDDDTRFQLVVLRGVETVYFALFANERWATMSPVVAPERFGAIPTTYPALRAYAEAFVTA